MKLENINKAQIKVIMDENELKKKSKKKNLISSIILIQVICVLHCTHINYISNSHTGGPLKQAP